MPRFLIRYVEPNLPDKCWREVTAEFEDWVGKAKTHDGKEFGPEITITAKQWAEDTAYTLADKGEYVVTELKG
jgi:hypothetical protein